MSEQQIEPVEEASVEFQRRLIMLVEEFNSKLPADIILLAIATILGKIFAFPAFAINKTRLKTMMRKKIGL